MPTVRGRGRPRHTALLLRFDQPDRRGRLHRHGEGLLGCALRQGDGRLHQLPHVEGRVRPFLRRAGVGRVGRRARVGEAELFRKLFAHRRNRAPRARHAALRTNETRRPARSADRQAAARGSAVTPGKFARRFLQPGGISESFEVRRPGVCAAHDPRARECALPALRADSSQHLHQRADPAPRDAADESASARLVCRADLRGRGLRRVDCDRIDGRRSCRRRSRWEPIHLLRRARPLSDR